jgi:Mg2+ and Co2+ transporter CorA
MGFFKFVTTGFINFFGITQPTPEQERRAAWFICGLLALIVLGAAAVFGVIVMSFGR